MIAMRIQICLLAKRVDRYRMVKSFYHDCVYLRILGCASWASTIPQELMQQHLATTIRIDPDPDPPPCAWCSCNWYSSATAWTAWTWTAWTVCFRSSQRSLRFSCRSTSLSQLQLRLPKGNHFCNNLCNNVTTISISFKITEITVEHENHESFRISSVSWKNRLWGCYIGFYVSNVFKCNISIHVSYHVYQVFNNFQYVLFILVHLALSSRARSKGCVWHLHQPESTESTESTSARSLIHCLVVGKLLSSVTSVILLRLASLVGPTVCQCSCWNRPLHDMCVSW